MHDSFISIVGFDLVVPGSAKLLCLAAFLGLLIGAERAWRHKIASLRTFSMICTGSCLFTMMSVFGASAGEVAHDPTRIAAQIVAGVGFLGGGVIFKTANRIEGITTAAMIWLAAAIGVTVGFGQVSVAIWAFFIWYALNVLSISMHRLIDRVQGRPRRSTPPPEPHGH